MALRCKQGDLALVIAGPDAGMLLTCLEPLPVGFERDDLPRGIRQRISEDAGPLWRVDRAITWHVGVHLYVAPDRALMPIRPEPDREQVITVRVPERAES
jgi:hypothetical protein